MEETKAENILRDISQNPNKYIVFKTNSKTLTLPIAIAISQIYLSLVDFDNTNNQLFATCHKLKNDLIYPKDKLDFHLYFINHIFQYASTNSNETLLREILDNFYGDIKSDINTKKFFESRLLFSITSLTYFSLRKKNKTLVYKDDISYINKAKNNLLKLHIQSISGVHKLKQDQQVQILMYLTLCLAEMSRWAEIDFYLSKGKNLGLPKAEWEYISLLTLDSLPAKTCLSHNALFYCKLVRLAESIIKSETFKERKIQVQKIKNEHEKILRERGYKLKKLDTHIRENSFEFDNLNNSQKDIYKNYMYLNEHTYFCNCSQAIGDKLKIETEHKHTTSDWANKYQDLVKILVNDFAHSRNVFYTAISQIDKVQLDEPIDNKDTECLRDAQLKNAFQGFYSILDSIACGLILVFDKEAEYNNLSSKNKLSFSNLFRKIPFDNELFERNFYLKTMETIINDIDYISDSPLKEFRSLRNQIEHGILVLTNEVTNQGLNKTKLLARYNRENFIEFTKIFALYVKSAIYTFVYIIRHETKIKDRECNKD